jgi:hypothetical protein
MAPRNIACMDNLTCALCRVAYAPGDSYPPLSLTSDPAFGWPRLVEARTLAEALEALDAVIQCEPFADVSPPGTEGFDVYELVAAAREKLARVLGVAEPDGVV